MRARIGVTMISSAISTMVVVVRCPVSDPKPRPTRNPMPTSSSSHNPILAISLGAGLDSVISAEL